LITFRIEESEVRSSHSVIRHGIKADKSANCSFLATLRYISVLNNNNNNNKLKLKVSNAYLFI